MRQLLIYIGTALLLCILSYILGYHRGQSTVKESIKTEVRYIPSNTTLSQSFPKLEPVSTTFPKIQFYPLWFRDTIRVEGRDTIVEQVDTAAILQDWRVRRDYQFQAFNNDTIGSLEVGWTTQFNRSSEFSYRFHPVRKEVDTSYERKKLFRVSAGLGTSDLWTVQAQYKVTGNFVVGYQYVNSFQGDFSNHFINLGLDF